MDAIERAAFLTVAKACGLAWLGIFCAVFGTMFAPPLAATVGAVMFLVLALILVLCARHALVKPYKKTEMWLYIDKADRPAPEIAQRVVGRVLHDTYQRFARQASVYGAVLLVAGFTLRALGIEEIASMAQPGSVLTPQDLADLGVPMLETMMPPGAANLLMAPDGSVLLPDGRVLMPDGTVQPPLEGDGYTHNDPARRQ